VIDRPIEDVFAFVADIEQFPKWESNFLEATKTSDGPVGVGTSYHCKLKVPGRRVESTLVVTEYVPNDRMAFRGDQPSFARPVGSFAFERADGGTRVTLYPRPQFGGVMKLLEPLMAGYVRRNAAGHVRRLKELLEST
jgi:uncharacterized protein YndB with AHSA1/START domain